MALCPNCGQEVSFLAYLFNVNNYVKNFFRFSKIHTCNNCNGEFLIEFKSHVLQWLLFFTILPAQVFLQKFTFLEWLKPPQLILVDIFGALFLWWKFVAKLEPYFEK